MYFFRLLSSALFSSGKYKSEIFWEKLSRTVLIFLSASILTLLLVKCKNVVVSISLFILIVSLYTGVTVQLSVFLVK